MKKCKRFLALFLVLCMTLSVVPFGALAVEDVGTAEEVTAAILNEPESEVETPDEPETEPATEPATEPVTEPATEPATEPIMVEETVASTESVGFSFQPRTYEGVSRALDTDTFYRIFHLDCGRKYFSVDQIKALIDVLAKNAYTHIELAIGNDGLRFLLDDMAVAANGTTYTSDAVKGGIQAGNEAYYDAGTNELTQTEMDTIISYASEKGIGIIPLINTPGHMDAILDCMESVGISNPAYSNSARTVDVTNTAAVNFTLALVNKYIQYFAGKGCTIFNMGCDEYANDVSNSGFAGLISSGKYGDFITFVNHMAAQVKAAGMTPMAFNDGIYYSSNTSSGTFDTDIAIAYWTSGWTGYSPASASFLAGKGHVIINTNDAWYYVLGRKAGNSSGYTIATAQNGVQNTACTDIPGDNDPTAAGCMICLWCDTPRASYSDTEVSNVTGLLSTFATNNPTYFATSGATDPDPTPDPEPGEPVEVTEYETITVTVGKTAPATISGANYAGTYTTEDPSIATVVVTGSKGTEATTTYTKASVTCNTLISSDSENWTAASGYYYKAENGNYYPVYAKRVSERKGSIIKYTEYTYTWGYKDGDSEPNQIGNTQSTRYPNYETPDITVYTSSVTEGTPASTTVTFTGVAVGTTYVTVGNTRYTINVVAEDLNQVTPLTVQYWITNLPVTAGGATSKKISAQSVYGEAGVDISTLVPETGTYAYGNVVYWKGTVLDSDHRQTTDGGDDETASGKDFSLVRYYNGNWQYYYEADGTWNTISDTDQVVIYWLQPTEVTKEITTLVKDWGFAPDDQGDSENKVALTVAVVYPDGTVSPAEGDMYSKSTTLFNYWKDRDIGLVAPVNNSDYEIARITVTNGTRDQSGTGKWGRNDTITWEKVTNEAGVQWYDETTYWDETVGGTPMVNGALNSIIWPNYNTAKLVLIYLKPVHYDTNLIVKWVDDSASGALISTMEVAVSSDGTPITFYNGLMQNSALPTEGVGGTFTLDDDAYVTNSSNVNQTFNKNISTVPGVADVYKTGLYQYVSADLSADGMTLTLHYNIDSTKLSKQYVVDFGLPVNIPLSDLVENSNDVSRVEITGGDAIVNDDNSVTYQPAAMLTGTATVGVKLTFGDNTTQTHRIAFVPATTVYYEEGFASYSDGWTGNASKGTVAQAKQVAGNSSDEYGFDAAYVNDIGASNGTQATSENKGDTCTFTFTGTGFEVYANCTPTSGYISSVVIRNQNGATVKAYLVNTVAKYGSPDVTIGQDTIVHSLPIISEQGMTHGTYTVTITHIKDNSPIYIDGFRIYETLATEPDFYTRDSEDKPIFIELRDRVLASLNAEATNSSQYADQIAGNTLSQVYATADTTQGVVITAATGTYTNEQLTDLLDNDPKNEIFLRNGQALTVKITTNREVQIGLKAPISGTTYTVNNGESKSINTSTDMFYTVLNKGSSGGQTITITNTGSGILSVTKLKVCDDPNAVLGTLTEEDLVPALLSLGFEKGPEPTVPFLDVAKDDWFYDAVKYVYENGLMYGTASDMFSPNSNATRGMIVTILYRESGSPDVNSDGENWWSDARVWAMENGISDGTNMDANITREQMAAMLYRYAKLMEADVSARGNLDKFSDREQISGWAVESVQWAVGEKIIAGRTNGTLDPQGLATRAEVAAMLMRFDKKLG